MLDTTAAKRAVHEQRKACAVDMESAGIAHAARRLQVPFLAIRIVLDEAGDSLPRAAANAVHANGNLNARGLVSGLVRNPKDVPALMALGRKSSLAQKQTESRMRGADAGLPDRPVEPQTKQPGAIAGTGL
jgi:adenosylhomocysteine nucleosidase